MLAVERAKIDLSTEMTVMARKAELVPGRHLNLEEEIDRATFERAIMPLVVKSGTAIDEALKLRGLRPKDMDKVLLVGGTSKIPLVRRFVAEKLAGKEPEPTYRVDPATCMAQGAAMVSAILQSASGLDDYAYKVKVEHSLCVPRRDRRTGRVFLDPVIKRGADIPCSFNLTYYAETEPTERTLISVYEGDVYDNPESPENIKLAEIPWEFKPPRKQRDIALDVTFQYGDDGVLTVQIHDQYTGQKSASPSSTPLPPTGALLTGRAVYGRTHLALHALRSLVSMNGMEGGLSRLLPRTLSQTRMNCGEGADSGSHHGLRIKIQPNYSRLVDSVKGQAYHSHGFALCIPHGGWVMVPGPFGLRRHFRTLQDPRRVNSRQHLLLDIIAIAICAVIANADDWQGVETFGHDRRDWLKTFLELPNGIPSHDTFERLFDALDPQAFQKCLLNWLHALRGLAGVRQVAIDGKVVRGSGKGSGTLGPLHLVTPGRRSKRCTWAKWPWTRIPTRSRPCPSCWNCWLWRGRW